MSDRTDRLAPPTILLAEDNQAVLRMVRKTLERNGFIVLSADNGTEVVEMARENRPDLILMDMMLPLLDGYASARVLRNDRATNQIPIIGFNAPDNGRASLDTDDEQALLGQIEAALEERALHCQFEVSSYVKERR